VGFCHGQRGCGYNAFMRRRARKRLRCAGQWVAVALTCLWAIPLFFQPFDVGLKGEHRGVVLLGTPWSIGVLYQQGWPDKRWLSRRHLRAPGEGHYYGSDVRLGFGIGWGTHRWNGNTPIIVSSAHVMVPWLYVIAFAVAPTIDAKLRPRRRLRQRRVRAMRRRRMWICRGCGYDLRATPSRCPECGLPVPLGQDNASLATRPLLGRSRCRA
jgi:hypothetical protein